MKTTSRKGYELLYVMGRISMIRKRKPVVFSRFVMGGYTCWYCLRDRDEPLFVQGMISRNEVEHAHRQFKLEPMESMRECCNWGKHYGECFVSDTWWMEGCKMTCVPKRPCLRSSSHIGEGGHKPSDDSCWGQRLVEWFVIWFSKKTK